MNTCKTCYCTGYIGVNQKSHDQVNRFEDIRRCLDCQFYIDDNAAQKAYIRQTERLISYSLWERLYRPLLDESGNYLTLSTDAEIDQAHREHRLWTQFCEDDLLWVEPRFGVVNRVAYYATEKPCHLNVMVDEMLTHETIRLTEAEATAVLQQLPQVDYPIEDIIDEKCFSVCDSIMDEHADVFVALCRQQRKPLADTLTLTWS